VLDYVRVINFGIIIIIIIIIKESTNVLKDKRFAGLAMWYGGITSTASIMLDGFRVQVTTRLVRNALEQSKD